MQEVENTVDLKELLPQHALLVRKTGLQNVNFKSSPSRMGVDREAYLRKDQDVDGEFIEQFDEQVIGRVETGLMPQWNYDEETYWPVKVANSRAILNYLVEKLNLRFPNNHPMAGKLITPDLVDPNNFSDAFFVHEKLQERSMIGGKYLFNLHKDPLDQLLFFVYKNNPKVSEQEDAKFRLIYPKQEVISDKKALEDEIASVTALGSLSHEQKVMIAYILKKGIRLNSYDNPDPDLLFVKLGEFAKSSDKFNNSTKRAEFLRLAKMEPEDLQLMYSIEKAFSDEYKVLTTQRGEFYLNMEKLEGVLEKDDLFEFFKKETNVAHYNSLRLLIREKDKIKKNVD